MTAGRRCPGLLGRHKDFVAKAVVERATPHGAAYMAAIAEANDKLAVLLGLGSVTRHAGAGEPFQTNLPLFNLSTVPPAHDYPNTGGRWTTTMRPQINVDTKKVNEAAASWRELMKLWEGDPRAEPGRKK